MKTRQNDISCSAAERSHHLSPSLHVILASWYRSGGGYSILENAGNQAEMNYIMSGFKIIFICSNIREYRLCMIRDRTSATTGIVSIRLIILDLFLAFRHYNDEIECRNM